ncbi:MAG: RNA methyltransferase [Firmicutes bacterium]|nr:RNA methyltransferase [Bacillota bacterium]
MVYTSVDNQYVKSLKKLTIKKHRDNENLFLIEGEHLILEAYKCGLLEAVIVPENMDFKIDVKTIYVSNNVLKYLSELETPTIIGVCKKMKEKELGDRILFLDDIQDPGNLGTIIRSAAAFNVDTIVLSSNTVDLYNSKVLRATQGMVFNINVIKRELLYFARELKEKGYLVYATKVNGGKSLKDIEKAKKFVIIMGNEGAGVKEELLNLADQYLYIDMSKKCESLNVGVATSIILYEFSK